MGVDDGAWGDDGSWVVGGELAGAGELEVDAGGFVGSLGGGEVEVVDGDFAEARSLYVEGGAGEHVVLDLLGGAAVFEDQGDGSLAAEVIGGLGADVGWTVDGRFGLGLFHG